MSMNVPFVDLKAQYASIRDEIDAAMRAVLERCEFIGGRELKAFEERFAAAHSVKHCIGVANGTDALVIILKALGIGRGDEVLTPANSFIASSEAVTLAGARPLFVDCDPDTYCMEAAQAEESIRNARQAGRSVKALMAVHLYGRAADLTGLAEVAKRHGLLLIEDCAQAHLAEHQQTPVGNFGIANAFSFYPGKNLGAYGDAGAVVTNDDALAERIRMLANHGRLAKYDHKVEGQNSRLDNLQAAVLDTKLRHLPRWTARRVEIARLYSQLLRPFGLPVPDSIGDRSHVFHLYVTRVKNRDRVQQALKERGIHTGVHYPIALPNLLAYRYLEHRPEDFPVASRYASEILSLPMYPEMKDEQVRYVAQSLGEVIR
jgi:dTDP-4-amino-4,6-dideoxygalactose transaminase